MHESSKSITETVSLGIRGYQSDHQKLSEPWSQLLKFLTAAHRAAHVNGQNSLVSSQVPGLDHISLPLSFSRRHLRMCWFRSTRSLGGPNLTDGVTRQMDRRDHGDPESVALATVHHNFHDWHEILEPMDSLLRQLLVKYDNLQTVLSAQDRHIADIHRLGILWEKSSNEVNRHFEGIQDQVRSKDSEVENCKTRLRECSEECGWLRGENSRLSRENRDLSQKEISMRATLDRFSRNLHSVTKENEDLKQRVRSKTKEPAEMDAGFESNPESEEELPSEASRIRRKRGSADLRVPKCGENVPQLNKKPRDEPVQRQEQLNNQFPSQLPTRNSESDNLRSKLKQAETHIINIGGNLGALLPREVVEEVRTD